MKTINLTQTQIRQATKEHFLQAFALMAMHGALPGAEVHHCADYIRFTSGANNPLLNGIYPQELPASKREKILKEQQAHYYKQKLPFIWWWHDEFATPEALQQSVALGLKPFGSMQGYAVALSEIGKFEPASEISVRRVTSFQEIIEWVNIASTVYHFKHNEGQFYTNYLLNTINSTAGGAYHYLGYLDNRPVGASSLIISTGAEGFTCGGLWGGAVLEGARKQGVGTAMAYHRAREAISLQAELLAAFITPDSRNYCEKLGLQPVTKLYPYAST
jgi:GNAT superfamily N-acetyltransferase